LRTELVLERFPEGRVRLAFGRFEEKGEVLAHLAAVSRGLELAFPLRRVVDKKLPVERLPADHRPGLFGLRFNPM